MAPDQSGGNERRVLREARRNTARLYSQCADHPPSGRLSTQLGKGLSGEHPDQSCCERRGGLFATRGDRRVSESALHLRSNHQVSRGRPSQARRLQDRTSTVLRKIKAC
jgi:hypothetical protein